MGFSADMDSGNMSCQDLEQSHALRTGSAARWQLVGQVPAMGTLG